ncbi:MAG: hypothetical protein ACP5QK_09830 [Myxococcota bacterium]
MRTEVYIKRFIFLVSMSNILFFSTGCYNERTYGIAGDAFLDVCVPDCREKECGDDGC